jgi:hypothetical protein
MTRRVLHTWEAVSLRLPAAVFHFFVHKFLVPQND